MLYKSLSFFAAPERGDQWGAAPVTQNTNSNKSREEEYEERIIELHCVIAELTRYTIGLNQ